MVKFHKGKKSKIPLFAVGIFLISTISILSLLDASEYVRCIDIGICEFLELAADLSASKKLEDVVEGKINFFTSVPLSNDFLKFFSIPPWLYYLDYSSASIQHFESLFSFFILYRNKTSRINQEVLSSLPEKSSKVLIDHKHNFPSIINLLPSPTLKLIAASIINS